mgnify:CR=1 FL=1
MEDFGVEVSKDIDGQILRTRQLWSNFLATAEYYFWKEFNDDDGRQKMKNFVYNLILLERDQEWEE